VGDPDARKWRKVGFDINRHQRTKKKGEAALMVRQEECDEKDNVKTASTGMEEKKKVRETAKKK